MATIQLKSADTRTVVDGYFNPDDNKFYNNYNKNTKVYTSRITGASNTVYYDKLKKNVYTYSAGNFGKDDTVEFIFTNPDPSLSFMKVWLTNKSRDTALTNSILSKFNSSLFSFLNSNDYERDPNDTRVFLLDADNERIPIGFLLKKDLKTIGLSKFINDEDFQTRTEVQTAISTALAGFTSITYDFSHTTLPASGQTGVFYMIPNSGSGNNVYDEYVYVNGAFELLGTTEVDLSGYLQTTKVASKGSVFQPVYFDSNGEAQPTTYQLNKTVPATAEFTDTTYTSGTGIDIDASNEISNTGVLSVSEGATNGTVSVNTGGTSAEVSVHGLGSMAYEDSADYATVANAVTDVAEGTANGQIAVTKNGTTTQIDVHGLGSAAFTESTDYATSGHNHDTEYASISHNHDSDYAPLSHTHNYAGSATAGGSATSAVRLDDASIGSANQGVYIDANGKPVAMTHTVDADVPSGAVFTDTTYTQGTGITIDSDNVISTDGEANVQADWNETDSSDDAFIQNKPTLGTASAKDFTTTIASGDADLITSGAVYTGLDAKVDKTSIGSANGVAELDSTGKIPSSQLPSFVDDVVEGYLHTDDKFYEEAAHTTEITGESSKIYVDLTDNLTYRWSGSAFVEISESIALGETSSTAYRGDRGKEAYDHSQVNSGNPHNVTATEVGLGSVVNTGDSDTPVSGGTTKFTTGGAYTELAKKQDVLTEGDNIDISVEGVISAIDTTYTQGTGIEITGVANAINLTSSTLASLAKADTALQASDLVFATDADIEALFA